MTKYPSDCVTVQCDEPFLSIGPDGRSKVTWIYIKFAAEKNIPILWYLFGEPRIIPANLVIDAWRQIENYMGLVRIGRTTEIPPVPVGFTWQQAVPLEDRLDDLRPVGHDEARNHADDDRSACDHP